MDDVKKRERDLESEETNKRIIEAFDFTKQGKTTVGEAGVCEITNLDQDVFEKTSLLKWGHRGQKGCNGYDGGEGNWVIGRF